MLFDFALSSVLLVSLFHVTPCLLGFVSVTRAPGKTTKKNLSEKFLPSEFMAALHINLFVIKSFPLGFIFAGDFRAREAGETLQI